MEASPYSERAALTMPRSRSLRLADELAERHHAAILTARDHEDWPRETFRSALLWLVTPEPSPEWERAARRADHPAHTEALALWRAMRVLLAEEHDHTTNLELSDAVRCALVLR